MQLGKDSAAVASALKQYWQTQHVDPNDRFLRDYIVNQRWKDERANHIPTYREVVGNDASDASDASDVAGEDQLSIAKKFELVDEEDDSELERQDEFEERYNFRFEEPGGTEIATYPR